MKRWLIVCVFQLFFLELCVAPGAGRDAKEKVDDYYNVDNLSTKEAQDREFDRYIVNVMKILNNDPTFVTRYHETAVSDVEEYGTVIEGLIDLLSSDIREKLNQLKKDEVAHQRQLLADNKYHMAGVERNEWNPIHLVDKETFGQEDMKKLLSRYIDRQAMQDEQRRQEFKRYEMKKELEHRERMKKGTKEEQAEEEERYKRHHKKKHERMHKPMSKAQMEEVWAEQHGLDRDTFQQKTYFNMHDTNSDGYLDKGELETFFVHDLNKVYDENDPDTDQKEREEEQERMRENVMGLDTNNDGWLSQEEFLNATQGKDFEKDKEWVPLTEKKQFSEEELEDFRSQLEKEGSDSNR